jgi:glutaredoxin
MFRALGVIALVFAAGVLYRTATTRIPRTAVGADGPWRGEPGAGIEPAEPARVLVYTTKWCPVCKRAKTWMADQQIAFEERDVEESSENARRMRTINPRGSVPTFDLDGDVYVGFSESGLMAAMRRSADRQGARISQ